MNNDGLRREQAKRLLTTICWCLAIGICVVPWVAGVPRIVKGIQAWRVGGAEMMVVYPPSQYKGASTGGWSESAQSAISAGLAWLAIGAILAAGLALAYLAWRQQRARPSSVVKP